MEINFPAILVAATALTGLGWLVDALLLASRRRKRAEMLVSEGLDDGSSQITAALKEPVWVEYCKSFFPVIFAVLLLRSFLVEPFRIPSGSMMPTLLVGDFILVNKFSYGIRLPVVNKKIIEIGAPERGDVVVFRYPRDPRVDYIKRIVGLPGDHIAYRDKVIYLNNERVGQVPAGIYAGEGSGISMSGASERVEQLGEIQHNILIMQRAPSLEGEFVVGEGEYFVMGDNRDNSNDSRFWGVVPEQNLVGKAFRIWMNWDSARDGIDWPRLGMKIQ